MVALSAEMRQYFSDYDNYHRHAANKICHFIGIPMILVGVLGLSGHLSFENGFGLGTLVWFGSTLFYSRLNVPLGALFSFFNFAILWWASRLDLNLLWALFIVGWIVQFIGHYVFEKKSPAFLKNFAHLLVGPFWIFCAILRVPR